MLNSGEFTGLLHFHWPSCWFTSM